MSGAEAYSGNGTKQILDITERIVLKINHVTLQLDRYYLRMLEGQDSVVSFTSMINQMA